MKATKPVVASAVSERDEAERLFAEIQPYIEETHKGDQVELDEGKDEMAMLMRAVFVSIDDIRYTDDVGDERVRALSYRARVNGICRTYKARAYVVGQKVGLAQRRGVGELLAADIVSTSSGQ